MIKMLALDLNGVYFRDAHQNFINNLKEKFNLEKEEIKNVYLKSQQIKKYKTGKISADEYWNWAIQEWHINSSKDKILEILAKGYFIDKKVKDLADKLKKKGIKIALCSNNFPERINIVDKKLNFLKNFDIKVFSYEVGVVKPNLKIFQSLIDKSGVKAEEILFFDDKEKNIKPAISLGFSAYLYNGFKGMVDKIDKLGIDL